MRYHYLKFYRIYGLSTFCNNSVKIILFLYLIQASVPMMVHVPMVVHSGFLTPCNIVKPWKIPIFVEMGVEIELYQKKKFREFFSWISLHTRTPKFKNHFFFKNWPLADTVYKFYLKNVQDSPFSPKTLLYPLNNTLKWI